MPASIDGVMIAVLGAGGVGGFLAGALARAGYDEVVVIAREPSAERIAREGIRVRSALLGEFVARPSATAQLDTPAEFLLVTTKATGLVPALRRVDPDSEQVVPLLNGLEHMALLRTYFGAGRVAAGAIRIESDRRPCGEIVQTSPSVRVDLAADAPALAPGLGRLATALERAGVPARIVAGESEVLWRKLVRLNAIACTTTAADRPIGFIRTEPVWRARLEACVVEAAAVARAEGVELDPAESLAELEAAHAQLGSSMQRDLAAGREPELDAIAGAVLRAGARHAIECPTIAALAAQIARRADLPALRTEA
jgi:2-dehydropantoate 2-reductase